MSDRLKRVRRIYDYDPDAYHRAMSSRFMEWMLGERRLKVGETVRGLVLDVGFGTGLSVPHYPAEVRVVGIDVSPKMLDVGRRFASSSGRRADVAVMDAEHLALPSRVFDSVAFNLCLCTIPNPAAAVREGVRVAKPGCDGLPRARAEPCAGGCARRGALNPVMVALQADHMNRRTADIIKRSGVEVLSIDRWFAGVFNLIVGRDPGG